MFDFPPENTVIVSRHSGAVEWLHQNGVPTDIQVLEQVDDPAQIAGKVVIGNLPAFLSEHAGEYWTIDMRLPREARGRELSPSEMDAYGANLVKVRRPCDIEAELAQVLADCRTLAKAVAEAEQASGMDLFLGEVRRIAGEYGGFDADA